MTAVRLRAAFVAASIAWAVLLVAVPLEASQPHVSAVAAALIAGVYAIGSVVCHQLPERSYHLWTAQMPVCARCTGIYVGGVLGAIAAAVRTAKAVRHTGGGTVRTAEAARHNGGGTVRTAEAVRHRRKVAGGVSPASALTQTEPDHEVAQSVSPASAPAGTEPGHEVAQGFSPANVVIGIFNPAWTPRMALAAAVAPTVISLAYEWTTGDAPSNTIRAAAGVPIGVVVAWLIVAATDNQVN